MYTDRRASSTDRSSCLHVSQYSTSIHTTIMSSILTRWLCVLACAIRINAIMQPTPSRTLSSAPSNASPAPRTMITQADWKNWLRSPASESSQHAFNTCGVSGTHHWYCVDASATCTNTLFSDGNVYQYCSSPGVAAQTFDTAVYDYYSGWSYSSWPAMGQYWCVLIISMHVLRWTNAF